MTAADLLETDSRRRRSYEIFVAAMDVASVSRTSFLDERCAGDMELRRMVEGLLSAATKDPLATQVFADSMSATQESFTGKTFGRFRLLELVGEGGMGVVYRAERTDGVEQSVAIKIISAGLGSSMRQRFEREAQLLARLEHPSMARLIDVGVEEGRAWIAMEFVRGQRIDQYCSAVALSVSDIVKLLVQLTGAVATAHGMLVVHSDIKPGNVLVSEQGVPKLIDFGIAAVLRDAGAAPEPTLNMGRLFSPNYAAPEQIGSGPITVATDVFGLGALAYRLLAGMPPHADAATPVAYLLAVTQHDVVPPSRAARSSGKTPAESEALRGDLDAILCKALHRDPAQRYGSATELQADFTRYLEQRPVAARSPTASYRLSKFVKRNLVTVSLASLLVASLVGGGLFATVMARRALVARDMAARRGEFLENLLTSANPGTGRRDISVAQLLDSAAPTLDHSLGGEPLVEASMLGLIAETNLGLDRLPEGLAANDRELAILRAQGADTGAIGRALVTRAQLFREQGSWPDTEKTAREAVSLLQPWPTSEEFCNALDMLAISLGHTSREPEAEATFRREIEIESHGGADLRKLLRLPYYSLAIMLGELGRYSESADAARKALELARRDLPKDHPDLLTTENLYASTLLNDKQSAAAEPIFREILASDERVFGPTHKATLLTEFALADNLNELHREGEAMPLALSAARGLETLLGDDNLYTWMAWQAYGLAACNHGEQSAGLDALKRVESARRRIYPAHHWGIYSTEINVGSCLMRMSRYAEAEPLLLDGATGLETARGLKFQRTQDGYRALQQVYTATGRTEDAKRVDAKLTK